MRALDRVLVRPPITVPTIDRANPITAGLAGLLWMGAGRAYDLCTGLEATLTNAPQTVQPNGVGRNVTAAAGNGVYYARVGNPNWVIPGALSLMAFENHTTSPATTAYCGYGYGSQGYTLQDQFASARTNRAQVVTSGGTITASSSVAWTTKECVRGLTWDGATLTVFEDGAALATGTGTGTVTQDTFSRLYWGGNPDVPQSGGLGYWMAVWSRSLTKAEAASLNAKPWQLFKPLSKTLPLWQTAVTAYYPGTETAAAGWTASTGGSLSSCINETTASDADYIISPDVTTPIVFAWAPTTLPIGTWDINWHGMKTGTTGQIRIVLLDAGSTVLATGSWHAQTGSFTNYTDTMTIASASTYFRIEDQA